MSQRGRRIYRIEEDWQVWDWTVPKGYTSNGITAPKYIRIWLGDAVWRKATWSAMFHDYLFESCGRDEKGRAVCTLSHSLWADKMFFKLGWAYGLRWKAIVMWLVVVIVSFFRPRP